MEDSQIVMIEFKLENVGTESVAGFFGGVVRLSGRVHTAYPTAIRPVVSLITQSDRFSTKNNPEMKRKIAPIAYANAVSEIGAGYLLKIGLW